MKEKLVGIIGLGLLGAVSVLEVSAERYTFVGHRAAGMGGAGSATVNDSSAQWHNPAAFGFFSLEPQPVMMAVTNAVTNAVYSADLTGSADTAVDAAASTNAPAESVDMDPLLASMAEADAAGLPPAGDTYDISYEEVMAERVPEKARVDNGGLGDSVFGWNFLGLGAGYTMTEDMPEYITQLAEIDFDAFDGTGLDEQTPESVENMLLMGSALFGLGSNPDNAFYVEASAGMNFRIKNLGFGIRAFGEVAGFVDYLDTENVGIEQTATEFIDAINVAAGVDSGFDPSTWTYQSITPGQLNISTNAGGSSAEQYIDYQLTQLKNDGVITESNIDDAVTMANLISYGVDPSDAESFENNQSTVTARGFGLVEIPVSYGYAFNDNLSVGVTAKGMYGTVTGTKVLFTEEDSFDAALDHLEENTEASFNFGLDLGVLYRMKMLQFAAVAHNINAPKFDGFTDDIDIKNEDGDIVATVPFHVDDYRIDPQVTLGAAFIPSPRFMVEMSYDLLETGTLMENYDIQRISFGAELDLWLLALRLGAYNNLAADWQDWIATAGVGLNLYIMRLDVGGAYSIGENTEYEGNEIPEEARLYASLSFEF